MIPRHIENRQPGELLRRPVQSLRMTVYISGENHGIRRDLRQFPANVEMFKMQVRQYPESHESLLFKPRPIAFQHKRKARGFASLAQGPSASILRLEVTGWQSASRLKERDSETRTLRPLRLLSIYQPLIVARW